MKLHSKSSQNLENPTPQRKPGRRWLMLAIPTLLALCLGLVSFSSGLVSQTNLVPDLVDFVRDLPFVGPGRMAALEDLYYNAQDGVTLFLYQHTHAPVVLAKSAAAQLKSATPQNALPKLTPGPALVTLPDSRPDGPSKITIVTPTPVPTATTPAPPKPIPPLIISDPLPGEGVWTTDGMPLADSASPPLRRTFYRPDPERPYVRVDLAWIDTSQTQLTLVPGTAEPQPVDKVKGSGVIPADVQSSGSLLAAWNGGFMTMHGQYGMMVNRRIVAPPRDGFAVLAQYADGSLRIGVWGDEIKMTPDLVSFRQNGPILIDKGVLNQDGLLAWGKSVSGETHIWRSGIGITQDGALIYAAGNAMTAQTLGEALEAAGAVAAMQLDVNAMHVYFYTYRQTDKGPAPTKLSPTIPGPTNLYLTPYVRDFMYLTAKQQVPR